jgi:hypothetical protein
MMNLNTATEVELNVYKLSVCKALGLDPVLLDFTNMPDAMGYGTNKVLYCKRGAAEVLRKNLGIDIVGLTHQIHEGWIMFTATAKDKSGRQEMAVGACYLQGLVGDRISTAVMTAQTRSIRRVTLQFVGGGILDETEVLTLSQLTGTPTASAALLEGSPMVIPPPVVQPWVVPAPYTPSSTVTPQFIPVSNVIPIPAPNVTTTLPNITVSLPGGSALFPPVTIDEIVANEKASRIPPPITLISEPTEFPSITLVPSAIDADLIADPVKPPKVRKPRAKKSAGFDDTRMAMPPGHINADGIVTPEYDYSDYGVYTSAPAGEFTENIPSSINGHPIEKVSTPVAASVVPLAAPPVVESVRPVEAQPQAAPPSDSSMNWRERSKHYSNKVLADGGMMPSEGIGGVTMKFRRFAQIHAKTETSLTDAQFEALFIFLDGFVAQFGSHALVAHIDREIGANQ